MFVYWVLWAVVAIGALFRFEHGAPTPSHHRGLLIAIVFITLIVGLRFHVGGDWGNYLRQFLFLSDTSIWRALRAGDPGYSIVSLISASLGAGIWGVNLVCAALFSFGLFKFLKAQPNSWLGLLVAVPYLIVVVAMGYTRQSVAIGLMMAGLADFDRRRIVKFVAYAMVALMFHKSAIVVLPIALLAVSTNRIVIGTLTIVLAASLYYAFVASSMDNFVGFYVTQRLDSTGALARELMSVPCALLCLMFRRHFRLTPDQSALWRNMSVAALAALAAVLVGLPSTAVDRLALYLIPLQIVVFSRLTAFVLVSRTSAQLATLIVVIYSAAVLYVWLVHGAYSFYWIPYRFYPFS